MEQFVAILHLIVDRMQCFIGRFQLPTFEVCDYLVCTSQLFVTYSDFFIGRLRFLVRALLRSMIDWGYSPGGGQFLSRLRDLPFPEQCVPLKLAPR